MSASLSWMRSEERRERRSGGSATTHRKQHTDSTGERIGGGGQSRPSSLRRAAPYRMGCSSGKMTESTRSGIEITRHSTPVTIAPNHSKAAHACSRPLSRPSEHGLRDCV